MLNIIRKFNQNFILTTKVFNFFWKILKYEKMCYWYIVVKFQILNAISLGVKTKNMINLNKTSLTAHFTDFTPMFVSFSLRLEKLLIIEKMTSQNNIYIPFLIYRATGHNIWIKSTARKSIIRKMIIIIQCIIYI